MNSSNLCKTIFAAMLLFVCSATFAQKENAGETWKKKVTRVIDLAQKEDDASHHLTDVQSDTSLLEMMVTAIKAGKLTAYSSFDNNFTTKLSPAYLKEMMASKVDTMAIVDPVTGTETIKIVHRDFNFDAIHKYRILEEWTFNPRTGKTEIQITGIAPLRDIYGDDGVYRGSQSMFWVRYNDARSIIARYEQYHPDNTLAGHIWADYFLSDVKPEVQK